MATTTAHYGFVKPSGEDNVDIEVLNGNMDKLDTLLYEANEKIKNEIYVDTNEEITNSTEPK